MHTKKNVYEVLFIWSILQHFSVEWRFKVMCTRQIQQQSLNQCRHIN